MYAYKAVHYRWNWPLFKLCQQLYLVDRLRSVHLPGPVNVLTFCVSGSTTCSHLKHALAGRLRGTSKSITLPPLNVNSTRVTKDAGVT